MEESENYDKRDGMLKKAASEDLSEAEAQLIPAQKAPPPLDPERSTSLESTKQKKPAAKDKPKLSPHTRKDRQGGIEAIDTIEDIFSEYDALLKERNFDEETFFGLLQQRRQQQQDSSILSSSSGKRVLPLRQPSAGKKHMPLMLAPRKGSNEENNASVVAATRAVSRIDRDDNIKQKEKELLLAPAQYREEDSKEKQLSMAPLSDTEKHDKQDKWVLRMAPRRHVENRDDNPDEEVKATGEDTVAAKIPSTASLETTENDPEPAGATLSPLEANVQPGAYAVEGPATDHPSDYNDDTMEYMHPLDEETSPPHPITQDNYSSLIAANLVSERDIVAAIPTPPWYRTKRFYVYLFSTLLLIGAAVGIAVSLASRSDSGSFTSETPVNDVCENAIDLLSVPNSTQNSTFSASIDNVPECESSSGSNTLETFGVWYMINGTGGAISASTCNNETDFDTEISVFARDCGSLQCIENNATNIIDCGGQSRVRWLSELDVQYYLLVHGNGDARGDFQLDVTEDNDSCPNAIGLPSIPSRTQGSASLAADDNVTDCESRGGEAPGVWYSMVGIGKSLSASTCNTETTFNTRISVFSGPCEQLECIAGTIILGSCIGGQVRINWDSEKETEYYILVHGLGGTGDFRLDVEEQGSPPGNDKCEEAIGPLSIPSSMNNSTEDANVDANVALCGFASRSTAPGIWYTVMGTGSAMVASTCNRATNFDTQISIFAGGCGNFECIAGNNDGVGCSFGQSLIAWNSANGTEYFVFVHGRGATQTGDFQLDIKTDVPPPKNDVCGGAFGPLSIPSTVEGSTVLAATEPFTRCGSAFGREARGIWYFIEGNGNVLSLSTCDVGTNFDTQLSVFSGNCTSLVCVFGNNEACGSQSRVTWVSEDGIRYYVLVHGVRDETGDFQLNVEDLGPTLDNDFCERAIGPLEIEKPTEGSISANATSGNRRSCGANFDEGLRAWFLIVGTGNVLSVSTTNHENTFDTQVSVFERCNSFSCIAAGDEGFHTNTGIDYYVSVLVQGLDGTNGDLVLNVTDLGPPVGNDVCQGAIALLSMPSRTDGSTIFATNEIIADCGEMFGGDKAPGVWYTIEGNGNVLSVSTCNTITNVDTRLSVFTGSCDSLECIVGLLVFGVCDDGRSRDSWASVPGTTYYVLVQGLDGARGDFHLDVEDLGPPLENDSCAGAIGPLSIPSFTEGSAIIAIADAVDECVIGFDGSAPGLWYTVVGTGNLIVASTCNAATEFDTQISIFSGGCDSLECIGGVYVFGDCDSGQRSSITWASVPGNTYYVLVQGRVGVDFVLDVEDLGPPLENDSCEGAIGPLSIPWFTEGSTLAANVDAVVDCGDAFGGSAPGLWYTVVGTDTTIIASTCNLATDFDTQISIFSGACGSLQCVAGNDQSGDESCVDQSIVSWNSVSGVIYLVLVHGFLGSTGSFTLTLTRG